MLCGLGGARDDSDGAAGLKSTAFLINGDDKVDIGRRLEGSAATGEGSTAGCLDVVIVRDGLGDLGRGERKRKLRSVSTPVGSNTLYARGAAPWPRI
jgi:hypothetical protein